jgi:hypothetical protein
MARFLITPQLKQIINGSNLSPENKAKLTSQEYICHHDLLSFYRQTLPTDSFLELVKTTKLYVPNKNIKNDQQPKTAEFLKSMEKLRLQAKEDEYQKLIGHNPQFDTLYETKPQTGASINQQTKELKSHITTIFNIIISVCSVVYAIWYWTESSWGLKDSWRVLLCLFFGVLVLVAEVVVYMGYLNKIAEARIKEQSKVEIKKVVRTMKLT